MSKRVLWKKGMRLTDSILSKSDECTDNIIHNALSLASARRLGLFAGKQPFSINVDITENVVDVISLSCHGVTRDGTLIDISYDSNFTSSFDTRVIIPQATKDTSYQLCVSDGGEHVDTNDGLCEQLLVFTLIEDNSSVPDNMLPVARIVYDEHCWRLDEYNFVPPCLFISASQKYIQQCGQFKEILSHLSQSLPKKFVTPSKTVLMVFWPAVQQLLITIDKECDVMTPMQLLGNIQKFISAFVCGCELDDMINIGEPQLYYDFINSPCDYRNVYRKIREGLDLVVSIQAKVDNFSGAAPVVPQPKPSTTTVEKPVIAAAQLSQAVKCGTVSVPVSSATPGAQIYFTTDGTTPTLGSASGNTITVESGFANDWHKEPPRVLTIKAIAVAAGQTSDVATFELRIRKKAAWEGKEI